MNLYQIRYSSGDKTGVVWVKETSPEMARTLFENEFERRRVGVHSVQVTEFHERKYGIIAHQVFDGTREEPQPLTPDGVLPAELSVRVQTVFSQVFGETSLGDRLADIDEEATELVNAPMESNMREELGDLLCSCIQLANERDWDLESVIDETLRKILSRVKDGKYQHDAVTQ